MARILFLVRWPEGCEEHRPHLVGKRFANTASAANTQPLRCSLRWPGAGGGRSPQIGVPAPVAGHAWQSIGSRCAEVRRLHVTPAQTTPQPPQQPSELPPARTTGHQCSLTSKNGRFCGKSELCYVVGCLDTPLPHGFNSWTQILTDWAVHRVWLGAKAPPCLKDHRDLAAPFVTEIGAAIRRRQFQRWAAQIDLAQAQATEPALDAAGGPAYLALRDEMESVQSDYLSAWRDKRSGKTEVPEPLATLRNRMERLHFAFENTRLRNERAAREAQQAAAKAFWAARDPSVIPDTYFSDEPAHAVAARLARIHPPWWGGFHRRLQRIFTNGHPADGCLLDALPGLRRQARKMTMEAMVSGWWQDNHARWGHFDEDEPHYPVLSQRAVKKARGLVSWFDATAPGYLVDQASRVTLHADLAERLREADPWPVPAFGSRTQLPWGEHGAN